MKRRGSFAELLRWYKTCLYRNQVYLTYWGSLPGLEVERIQSSIGREIKGIYFTEAAMNVSQETQDQDGEKGAQLCCPVCGSFFLCSDKSGGGAVFHVFDMDLRSITILREADGDGAPIDRQAIACGACSWQGSIDDLVDSSMS